jgi:hypothetical protein
MKFKTFLATFLFLGVIGLGAVSIKAYSPDYTDSTFTFGFSGFDEDDYTNARKKGSDSSMYLYNTSTEESFSAKPQADSHYGSGTSWVTVNSRGYFTAQAGKRYEVYNTAHEDYWDGVQVRFYGHKDLWYKTVTVPVKWSPDYTPMSGVTVIEL